MSTKRKPGIRRVWAADTVYPPGALTWSGQATKVEPSAGVVAAGHVPGQLAPAEWENYTKYMLTSQADYLDAIEVQNIEQIGAPVTTYMGASPMATQIFDVCTSTYLNKVYTAGEFMMSNELVRNWLWTNHNGSNGGSPAGGGWKSIDEALYAGAYQIVAVGGGPQITHFNEATNTWTNDNSPGANCSGLNVVRCDQASQITIAGGIDNSGTPRPHILRYTGVSTLTDVVPSGAAAFAGPIDVLNVSRSNWYLAIFRHATVAMMWTSTNQGTTWTQQAAAPFLGENPVALSYDENIDTHYCITAGGKVYAAVAGSTTWTLRGTVAPALATFAPRCLAVKGSIVVALGNHTLWGRRLFYSTDLGVNWSQVTYIPLSSDPIVRRIYGGRQLFIASNATTPLCHIGQTLHLR